MTSAAITELGMQKAVAPVSPKQPTDSSTQNFADFMTKDQAAGASQGAKDVKPANADAKTAYEKSDKKAADSISKDADQKVSSPKPEKEAVAESVSEDKEQIVKDIADKLDVSEEDVEAAMEVLGLTVIDLMTQAGMTQLIAQLSEVQPVEILTDGDLFAQMESLTGDAAQILTQTAEDFGMDVEQFTQLVTEASEQAQPETADMDTLPVEDVVVDAADGEDVTGEQAEKAVTLDTPKVIVTDDRPAEQTVAPVREDKTEVVSEQQTQERPVQTAENLQQTAQSEQQTGQQAEQQNDQTSGRRDRHETDIRSEATLPSGMQQTAAAPEMPIQTEEPVEQAQMPRTQEIIDQIADYVKVHRSEQITEMEISLNPASLGNIHLQVASKAGTVSAQLIAQDQAVAAALESQIVMLKESLEAQGMRVDAVEVTVASHGFEQNLDQQGKEQEEEAQRAASKKGQRKILDLNEMDAMEGETEELTDAERLQVEMMRMGGNRMNYQI